MFSKLNCLLNFIQNAVGEETILNPPPAVDHFPAPVLMSMGFGVRHA